MIINYVNYLLQYEPELIKQLLFDKCQGIDYLKGHFVPRHRSNLFVLYLTINWPLIRAFNVT